eukprot:2571539-Amphidinium_carterae.2
MLERSPGDPARVRDGPGFVQGVEAIWRGKNPRPLSSPIANRERSLGFRQSIAWSCTEVLFNSFIGRGGISFSKMQVGDVLTQLL